MDESSESKNVSSVDTSCGDERKLVTTSPCNATNGIHANTSKGEQRMISPQCPNMPVPYPPPDFRHLAELYWKHPTVHQTFVVSPGLHTNQALLAKARRKSEKLKRELEKEPHENRVSHDAPSYVKRKASRKTADFGKTDSRKSKAVISATAAPVQQRRRTVNMSIVAPTTKNVNVNRRLTLQPMNRGRKGSSKGQKASDPGAALAEFRTSKGLSKPNAAAAAEKVPVYTETPVVLDALREQREDLEKREVEINQSTNLAKLNRKCCDVFQQCLGSYTVACVAFFVIVIIIIILCISAIVYPIIKAVMIKKGPKSKL